MSRLVVGLTGKSLRKKIGSDLKKPSFANPFLQYFTFSCMKDVDGLGLKYLCLHKLFISRFHSISLLLSS